MKGGKNYFRPSADDERAALAWATKYFHNVKSMLKKGFPEDLEKHARDGVIQFMNSLPEKLRTDFLEKKPPADFFSPGFNVRQSDTENSLRRICADLLQRDGRVPPELADFAAASLRGQNVPAQPGRKGTDLVFRYVGIAVAVDHIMRKWGFLRTRSRFNSKGACAVSITKEALASGANLHLSEDEIIRGSKRGLRVIAMFRPFFSQKTRGALKEMPAGALDYLKDEVVTGLVRDDIIRGFTRKISDFVGKNKS